MCSVILDYIVKLMVLHQVSHFSSWLSCRECISSVRLPRSLYVPLTRFGLFSVLTFLNLFIPLSSCFFPRQFALNRFKDTITMCFVNSSLKVSAELTNTLKSRNPTSELKNIIKKNTRNHWTITVVFLHNSVL